MQEGRQTLGVTSWCLPARGADGLVWAHENGFGSLHLDSDDFDDGSASILRRMADSRGIILAGLSVVALERVGLRGKSARDAVERAVEHAVALGVGYVYLPAFGRAALRNSHDIRAMSRLLDLALATSAGPGLTIASENTLDPGGLQTLLGSAPIDRLELLFDTQNPVVAGLNPLALIDVAACHIRSFVHVKDGDGGLGEARLGSGSSRVWASVIALLEAGFSGTFVLESDYRVNGRHRAKKDQDRLRRVVAGHKRAEKRKV